jgi:desulfoferrodoxin (superoxide reductase-like protein)
VDFILLSRSVDPGNAVVLQRRKILPGTKGDFMTRTMKRTMTKVFWTALIIGLFSLANIQVASAHPPKEVSISYDRTQQTLSVTISHKTTFTSRHYIESVTITKNKTVVSTEEYTNQPKEKPFTYTYQIPAAAGDTLEVKATCKIFGSKEAMIKVE